MIDNKKTPPLEWYTKKLKVKELVPCSYNPRKITPERLLKLKKSLEKYNLAEIPDVNTDYVIIAGHQRVKVLMDLNRGDELIDVRVPNRKLTENEFKEYNVISNVSVGYWDLDILEDCFADINLLELGLDTENIEIPEDIIPLDLTEEDECDPDLTLPKTPQTHLGDFYELISIEKGISHRVICGDSTLSENYQILLGDKNFDLIITDPPYNVNYEGKTKDFLKIKNDKMDNDSFYIFLFSFYKEAFINSKAGASIYVFHADSEGDNFRSALKNSGFKLSQCLIWLKNTLVMGRQDYHWKHEPILYGWKEGSAHSWYSDRKQTTILEFDRPVKNAEHPTMKPIDIITYLIKNSSKQKDVVGDLFLGGGSTLISCEKTWRNCYGMELDPIYVDVDVRRWVNYMTDNKLDFIVKKNNVKMNKEELKKLIDI